MNLSAWLNSRKFGEPAIVDSMKIVLFGAPCVGKTTVGQILGQKLNCPFIDVDEVIQTQYGTISKFQRKLGIYNVSGRADVKQKIILDALRDYENVVVAASPMSHVQLLEDSPLCRKTRIIELTDHPENIYARIYCTDENDQYDEELTQDFKENKEHCLLIIEADALDCGEICRRIITERFDINGASAEEAASAILLNTTEETMEYHNFSELIAAVKGCPSRERVAVAAAGDEHTLEAVLHAQAEGIVEPVLVGDKKEILRILNEMGAVIPDDDIYDIPDPISAAEKAVALVREGQAALLMKGRLDTSVFLRAAVDKQYGLGTKKLMSHVALFEVPGYHKLLCVVDGGMIPYPTLEQKKGIIENTVGALHKLGYSCPKVGVLACVEKVNRKMPETLDAAELKRMCAAQEITGCMIDGPVSYDCAMRRDIAELKGFESPISGECDILLAPNIHTGNIMGKIFTTTCRAKMAGMVMGASCPIIMTSRGSSAEEKFLSIVLAVAAASREE